MSRVLKPAERDRLKFIPGEGIDRRFVKSAEPPKNDRSAPVPSGSVQVPSGSMPDTAGLLAALSEQAEQVKALLAALPKPVAPSIPSPAPIPATEYRFDIARNYRGLITAVTAHGGGETWDMAIERADNGHIAAIVAKQREG